MGAILNRFLPVLAAVAASLACACATQAQSQGPAGSDNGLGPVLANIKKTGTVRLGYRDASPPFSFLDPSGRPIGYSIELCGAIVQDIAKAIDEPGKAEDAGPAHGLKIEYVKVTSETRIPMMVDHKIDLECGSTTANAERAKLVAFSPLMFVAGTKILVARNSGASSIKDLKGKTIVVTRGTTNETAIQAANRKWALGLTVVTGADHEESFRMLADHKADAFATDDVLLYGLVAHHKAEAQFQVVGEYLSYDPYGIMYSKDDPGLKPIVERTFRTLAAARDLAPLYSKWFEARLPTGERINVPMSPQLEDSFNALGAGLTTGN